MKDSDPLQQEVWKKLGIASRRTGQGQAQGRPVEKGMGPREGNEEGR